MDDLEVHGNLYSQYQSQAWLLFHMIMMYAMQVLLKPKSKCMTVQCDHFCTLHIFIFTYNFLDFISFPLACRICSVTRQDFCQVTAHRMLCIPVIQTYEDSWIPYRLHSKKFKENKNRL